MVDNVTAPASGQAFATDEIGGVHYPRTKISFGGDGAAVDVATGNPLPVADPAGTAAIAKLGTFKRVVAIAKADADLSERPAALYIGTGGTLDARFGGTTEVRYLNIPDGSWLTISPSRIAASSTVAGIIGHFYE